MKNNTRWRAAVGGTLLALPLTWVPLAAGATADPAPPTAAAAVVHDFTVVKVVGQGDYEATDDQMLTRINQAIDFWGTEAGGAADFEPASSLTELRSTNSCSNATAVRQEARDLFPDRKFDDTSGHHLIVLFPLSCKTGGQGTVGTGLRSGGVITANMGPDDSDVTLGLVHEIGHNLGLLHAGGLDCDTPGCPFSEYYNRYSSMGVNVTGMHYTLRPLDSYERSKLGLASADEVDSLAPAADRRVRTVDVDLRARGTDSGLRGLKLTALDGTTYYLDLHDGVGREAGNIVANTWKPATGHYFNKGVSVEQIELERQTGLADPQPVSVLQPARDDGTNVRYAMEQGDSFTSSDGTLAVTVSGLDLSNPDADTIAHLHVTLTNPNVPLGTQSGTIAINDTAAVGSTVTATTAGWADATLSGIRWRDNGVVVGTGPSYTIPATADGHSLTAEVTGTRESYHDETAVSNTLVVGRNLLVDNAAYAIRSQPRGQLLATPGAPTASGTQVVLQTGDTPLVRQEWRALANTDGSFRLKNAATGRCLDNTALSNKDGSKTIEWSCNGGVNQNWRLAGSGTGYTLVNVGSGKATTAGSDGTMSQLNPGTVFTFSPVG